MTLLKKRLVILARIDDLMERCNHTDQNKDADCKNCAEIKKLGEKLTILVNKREVVKGNGRVYTKKGGGMSQAEFDEYKNQKLTYKEIAKLKGVSETTVKNWVKELKVQNGGKL